MTCEINTSLHVIDKTMKSFIVSLKGEQMHSSEKMNNHLKEYELYIGLHTCSNNRICSFWHCHDIYTFLYVTLSWYVDICIHDQGFPWTEKHLSLIFHETLFKSKQVLFRLILSDFLLPTLLLPLCRITCICHWWMAGEALHD